MPKDLIFHINISQYKRNEIATVGHPDTPELTDDYASKLVKAGWASWYNVDIVTVDNTTPTSPAVTEAAAVAEPVAEEVAEEIEPEKPHNGGQQQVSKKQRRRAQKDES